MSDAMDKLATLTEDKRTELKRQLDEIDKAVEVIEKQREPWDRAISALLTIRDELVERDAGAEIAGTCETCTKLLFYGEQGHNCTDGPLLCERCAPTWNDLRKQYDDMKERGDFIDSFDSPFDAETADKLVEQHIAAGDGDKPNVWTL